jgi:catalase (peroxidase I)
LKDNRHDPKKALSEGDGTGLEKPLGAVQMGLIYVNPVS